MTVARKLVQWEDGRMVLPDHVHPMPDLLNQSADQILDDFRHSQRQDFTAIVAQAEQPGSALHDIFAQMAKHAGADNPFHRLALFQKGGLEQIFLDLHDHVMSHPVWRHPFFLRVFEGAISPDQVKRFAIAYFNQIKNTRQCVSLAIGRFHGLMDLPFDQLNEPVSEITQIALAQLVADEYGVGVHAIEDYPDMARLLKARTHIAMYRQVFDGLAIAPGQQDQPMLWGVADNVLTQRLVAGHPSFSALEALASVGLGMEWGVPEFFSLLLGGLIRVSEREKLGLTPRDLEVFIAHVRYDVLHAVSVMLVTSLHMTRPDDLASVKNACNTLMAGRYGMMGDLYRHVFGEACPGLNDIGLDARYGLTDRRIETALIEARGQIDPKRVQRGTDYRQNRAVPFVFA